MSQTNTTPRIYRLPKKNTNPTKRGVVFPPSVSIPSVDEIYEEYKNEAGETVRGKRIIQYSKGERSIYKDEQSNGAKPSKIPTITEGFLIVSFREVLLINFLDKCNWNKSNENRDPGSSILFQGVAKGQDAVEYVRVEKQKWAIRNKIFSMSGDELEGLALVLNVPGWDEKITEELQRDLLVVANRDPAFFDKVSESSDSKKKYNIVKASKLGIIVLDQKMCSATWANGKEICQGTLSDKIEDYLVNFFESKQGEQAYTHMLELTYPKNEIKNAVAPEPEKTVAPKGDNMTSDELISKALDGGILKLEGPWYRYKSGTDEEVKVKGKKTLSEKLMEDEELRNSIITEIKSLETA